MLLNDLYWVLGEQKMGPLEYYVAKAIKKQGEKVEYINIHDLYWNGYLQLSGYSHRFPRKIDNAIQRKLFSIINNKVISLFDIQKPSCVFIYNDCKMLPSTIEYFKKNGCKIVVFLGDDPNYLWPGKKTFLLTVMAADSVISCDSGWRDGLNMVGVKNIIYSPIGSDPEIFHPCEPTFEQMKEYQCDILFVGKGYFLNSFGIRRAAILNELCGLDFKLYGGFWNELLYYFPKLENHLVEKWLSAEEVNIACNCAKIYPVLINAGIINGATTRVMDCSLSGIFILCEYRKDIEILFPNGEVVMFHSKNDLRDKVEYFLKNENEMKAHVNACRDIVQKKYTLETTIKEVLEKI
jgi:spore maturation protein CgeB